MKYGIQFQKELDLTQVQKNGISYIEIPYTLCPKEKILPVCGVLLALRDLTTEKMKEALSYAKRVQASYLVLDTREVHTTANFYEVITNCLVEINEAEIPVYLENGFVTDEAGQYHFGPFSETRELKKMAVELDEYCMQETFGVALNVGYANLLALNLKAQAEEAGKKLYLVHMNDNDGKTNQKQMPYTFTVGRGTRSTDLYRLMGTLFAMQYEGYLVFDATGVFRRAPKELQGAFLRLLKQLADVWNEENHFEEKLDQPQKKIILFGAGRMVNTYLKKWGEKYPPFFLVDNNASTWGKYFGPYKIQAPESILEIPEKERTVIICTMYYDAIEKQLDGMGVSYQCFWDQYYL